MRQFAVDTKAAAARAEESVAVARARLTTTNGEQNQREFKWDSAALGLLDDGSGYYSQALQSPQHRLPAREDERGSESSDRRVCLCMRREAHPTDGRRMVSAATDY
uniref:Uncharacterized protein n=1 Tax=Plectus sambesii TaxID=2011161 RepID=A0A914VAZ6_9BILA